MKFNVVEGPARRWRVLALTGLLVFGAIGFACGARAETVRVLALGASNTNGRGVETSQAWPAQLERMLRAKGLDVSVSVYAINGITSEQILGSVNSQVSGGTSVVIFDNGGDNDRKRGLTQARTKANTAAIAARIRVRGAIPIQARYMAFVGPMYSSNGNYQGDGHHLSVRSHSRVAAALVPQVIAAIKKKR